MKLRIKALVIALAVACFAIAGVGLHDELEARAFRAGRYTVTTTAAAYFTAPRRGAGVLLCNRHTASVFLGGDNTLTTANGFELEAAACTSMRPFPNEAIWMIVGSATARVDWAEGDYRE